MKKMLSIVLAALMLLSCCAFAEEAAFVGIGEVQTKYGAVSGYIGKTADVTVFNGIPYAQPPVGDLRWREPQDPQPWEGVRECVEPAAAPMQPQYAKFIMRPGSDFYPNGQPEQSEDCLYLNVTTPAVSADEKLPVMIWFHGGGLAHGWSTQVPFDGEALASKGVIVVTVSARLNALGYLSLPQLSAESGYGASGNYGLMDCIKSVNWVYENIAAFGGDPENIMVFGQSGGSAKTAATVAAPQTRGQVAHFATQSSFNLFDGIAEGVMGITTLEKNEETGLKLLDELGLPHDVSLEELRALPADKIAKAQNSPACSMTIDGKYIVDHLSAFYLGEGNLDGIELMAGWVFGESGSYEAATAAELFAKIREEYGNEMVDKYDLENTMPITDSNVGFYNMWLKQASALAPLRLYAQLKNERNADSPTYLYSFGRVTPNKNLGWHSGELWYIFNNMDPESDWEPKWEVYDFMVGETTSSYWTNFARTGNPNGKGLANWPAAEGDGLAYQYIDTVCASFDEMTSFDQMVQEVLMTRYGLSD